MSVRKRWINFLYNISTGTKKVRNLLTPVGLIIFGVFIFVFVLASIYLYLTDYIKNSNNSVATAHGN